jgi:hypothetical protein
LILSIAIGTLSAAVICLRLSQGAQEAADFTWSWRAAQMLLAGENPYQAIQPSGAYPYQTYFYYPLPAALVALPFAWLLPHLAGALFFGISAGWLAFALTRSGWKHLPLFLSAPFFVSAAVVQWAPLLLAAAFCPWSQALLACKPNLGLGLFLYKPSWRGLLTGAALIVLSWLILPSWPFDWLKVVKTLQGHPPPFLILPLGPILLLALLRWRFPEGRLFLALSLLPQLLFFYDQLPLWLVAQDFRQSLLLSALSWVAYFTWRMRGMDPISRAVLRQPGPHILALIYLPALLLLLLPELKRWRKLPGKMFALVVYSIQP